MESLFWADQLADQIVERATREKKVPNIKCQQTPSGGKHIGNLNDVIRAYFPYKVLQERGVKATFVHSTDDRDPLKDIPKRLPDLEGKWHEAADLKDMKPYLGMPLCRIPDPFGCCKTWSIHFTKVWMDGVSALGMHPTLYSTDQLYKDGKMEAYIKMVFEQPEAVGKLITQFQQSKAEGYIPFDAICSNCGRLVPISGVDINARKVMFHCEGKNIKKKKSEGCGFKGEVPWTEGKLQWRFEWPAMWGIFQTTYEPFGKDHAEGSWKSGVEIMRTIYKQEPPIPYVYEFFLVNGEKMSASVGNVYIVQDMLRFMEKEVFMYFYTKRPGKQRNFDLKNINLLVEDFENAERIYFDPNLEPNEKERESIRRSYAMCVDSIPSLPPLRIPYTFASMIAQSGLSGERAIQTLQESGHVPTSLSAAQKTAVLHRIAVAGTWAREVAEEKYRFTLQEDGWKTAVLSSAQKKGLAAVAQAFEKPVKEADILPLIRDVATAQGIDSKELFQAAYRVLLGKDAGPRLAPFVSAIGTKRVAALLQKAT